MIKDIIPKNKQIKIKNKDKKYIVYIKNDKNSGN